MCTAAACGDGLIAGDEPRDDGNDIDGDGHVFCRWQQCQFINNLSILEVM